MATSKSTQVQTLTQLEFTPADFDVAHRIADHLGYKQTPYTTTSSLWGVFCLKENPEYWRGPRRALQGSCIIKTKELGFLVVQSCEDLGLGEDGRPE